MLKHICTDISGCILSKIRKKKRVIFYFLAKGQKVNIVGFVTHTISVADTQLCCCGTEA